MRKKTAPRTRKQQATSSTQQSGLIAREKNAMQLAVTKSALDNRFHTNGFAILLREQHADPDREPQGDGSGPVRPTASAAIARLAGAGLPMHLSWLSNRAAPCRGCSS